MHTPHKTKDTLTSELLLTRRSSTGHANVQDRAGASDAASGSISVEVSLALSKAHGIGLAFWQAEQALFVVEV
jgi:hypothetical protein